MAGMSVCLFVTNLMGFIKMVKCVIMHDNLRGKPETLLFDAKRLDEHP